MNSHELADSISEQWGSEQSPIYIKVGDKYYLPTECHLDYDLIKSEGILVIETKSTNLKKIEKQSGITVRITARELFDRGIWMEACELTGLNDWAISEGRMDYSDIVELTEVQAKQLGIFNHE